MNKLYLIVAVVVVIVGAGAFFAGMKFQETKATTSQNQKQFQGGNRQGMRNGQPFASDQGRFAGGATMGEIISSDDKSVTIKLDDGSSKIVLLSDTLTVTKTDTGSKADLKIGVKVGVFGMSNSDGTITAQSIQLNPMFRGPAGMGQNSPSPNPSVKKY